MTKNLTKPVLFLRDYFRFKNINNTSQDKIKSCYKFVSVDISRRENFLFHFHFIFRSSTSDISFIAFQLSFSILPTSFDRTKHFDRNPLELLRDDSKITLLRFIYNFSDHITFRFFPFYFQKSFGDFMFFFIWFSIGEKFARKNYSMHETYFYHFKFKHFYAPWLFKNNFWFEADLKKDLVSPLRVKFSQTLLHFNDF